NVTSVESVTPIMRSPVRTNRSRSRSEERTESLVNFDLLERSRRLENSKSTDQDRKIMQLEDTVDLLQDQDLKFEDFENSLDMLQEQVDWEERNVSESLSAAQQKTAKKAPASNKVYQVFENNYERKKALCI
ncbi:22651_t:CDS:2, partial [Dentiscutata erythropus]